MLCRLQCPTQNPYLSTPILDHYAIALPSSRYKLKGLNPVSVQYQLHIFSPFHRSVDPFRTFAFCSYAFQLRPQRERMTCSCSPCNTSSISTLSSSIPTHPVIPVPHSPSFRSFASHVDIVMQTLSLDSIRRHPFTCCLASFSAAHEPELKFHATLRSREAIKQSRCARQ